MKYLIIIFILFIQIFCSGQIDARSKAIRVADSCIKNDIGKCLFEELLSTPSFSHSEHSNNEVNKNIYILTYHIEKYNTNQNIVVKLDSNFKVFSKSSYLEKFDNSKYKTCNLISWEKLKNICEKRGVKPERISISFGEYGVIAIYRRAYLFNSSCTVDHYIDLQSGKKIYRGRVCRTF